MKCHIQKTIKEKKKINIILNLLLYTNIKETKRDK